MIGRIAAIALTAAALVAPAVAVAQVASAAIDEKKLTTGKATIDPAKGYIYFHGPSRLTMVLLKTPSDAQRAKFEADWKEGFDKAKKKYPAKLAR